MPADFAGAPKGKVRGAGLVCGFVFGGPGLGGHARACVCDEAMRWRMQDAPPPPLSIIFVVTAQHRCSLHRCAPGVRQLGAAQSRAAIFKQPTRSMPHCPAAADHHPRGHGCSGQPPHHSVPVPHVRRRGGARGRTRYCSCTCSASCVGGCNAAVAAAPAVQLLAVMAVEVCRGTCSGLLRLHSSAVGNQG